MYGLFKYPASSTVPASPSAVPCDVLPPATSRRPTGSLVPMPTYPPFVTAKLVALDEPITNEGPEMPFGFIDSCAHGVEVPSPSRAFATS